MPPRACGRQWSDREIARRCAVSHEFASRVRRDTESRLSTVDSQTPAERTYIHNKTGQPTQMQVGGRRRAEPEETPPTETPRADGGGAALRAHWQYCQ